jgi:hypothetical protein
MRKFFILNCILGLILIYERPIKSQFLGNIGSTSVTSCGTGSPTVSGDNTKGVITVGTVATTCTLNFSHTLSVTPGCVFSPSIGGLTLPTLTITASSAVINFGVQAIGNGKISYWCFDPTPRF